MAYVNVAQCSEVNKERMYLTRINEASRRCAKRLDETLVLLLINKNLLNVNY